jgi:3',5'-cyclic AMP phosphodiesterase CpdA
VNHHRIVHLSDLHYGPPFQYALEPILLEDVEALAPDLVIVSGDLTMRARKAQFEEARAFLDRLPKPYLVIPGNHEVPLFNGFNRLFRPFRDYKRYIHTPVDLTLRTRGILAVGLTSAHSWLIDRGQLTRQQLRYAEEMFRYSSQADLKILITHHHFVRQAHVYQRPLPEALLSRFAGWGVDMVLVGHTHLPHVEQRPDGLVLIQAGTATSNRWKRLKRHVNSYYFIRTSPAEIAIQAREYDREEGAYLPTAEYHLERNVQNAQNSAIMEHDVTAQ